LEIGEIKEPEEPKEPQEPNENHNPTHTSSKTPSPITMPKRTPLTTPDWQAAVRRRSQFYLLVVLFGVLVFQFFIQQQDSRPQV